MSKLGNKGQSLAIFVIFIPVFIMIGTLVVDVCYAKYNARRLDNIAKEVLRYGLKHIEEEPFNNMVDLIYQNDSEIDDYKIDIDNENKRILKLFITESGKETAKLLEPLREDFYKNMVDGFSDNDIKDLYKLLEKIRNNMRTHYGINIWQ